MDRLRVRMYNVRFGDAFLLSIPDKDVGNNDITRHILIDVGNALNSEGGIDTLFAPVIEDILNELDGQALDLYVMTHEHMDHVQGLYYSNKNTFPNHDLAQRLQTCYAWLPVSSDPYYINNKAEEKIKLAAETYDTITKIVAAFDCLSAPVETLLEVNNPRKTGDCVDYLRNLTQAEKTFYVYRGMDMTGKHEFREAKFEIWAPEKDVAPYFAGVRALVMDAPEVGSSGELSPSMAILPPRGVDAGAFYNLVESRRARWADALLTLDKSINNTSVVFCLEWHGRRLLFPGDAEIPSWTEMDRNSALKQVDFLKISHHGSYNGTPPLELLEKILPGASQLEHPSALSSFDGQYDTIPDGQTLALIKEHSQVMDIRSAPEQLYQDIFIAPED
jgi:hypothetical protein